MTTMTNLMGTGTPGGQAQALAGFLTNTATAAGTTQGTAYAIPTDFVVFTTVALNSGAILPTAHQGDTFEVANHGANPLSVYPPTGGAISTGATNAAISVPVGKMAKFKAISSINFAATVGA